MIGWGKIKTQQSVMPDGAGAEQMAEAYLRQQGLKIVQRNFSCKQGEIDLIMEDQQTLVFVEVRFRKSSRYGSATETVTYSKQRKLIAAAQYYLLNNHAAHDRPLRFDIVGVTPKAPNAYEYTWLRSAFDGV